MTHEVSLLRMRFLSMYEGTIGVEEVGEEDTVEIVVRLPMSRLAASDAYYELGNMGV